MLVTLKENSVYRLNDIIYRYGDGCENDRTKILTSSQYKNTILRDYLEQKRFELDLVTFKRITKEHANRYERPDKNTLVVHLRLGDIMDPDSGHGYRGYEYCASLFSALDIKLPASVTKCTIVTALHYGAHTKNGHTYYQFTPISKTRSLEILDLVIEKFTALGLAVSVKSSEHVDEDICFMSQSTFFMKGNSGLSKLVCSSMDNGTFYYENACSPHIQKVGVKHVFTHVLGPCFKYYFHNMFSGNEKRYS